MMDHPSSGRNGFGIDTHHIYSVLGVSVDVLMMIVIDYYHSSSFIIHRSLSLFIDKYPYIKSFQIRRAIHLSLMTLDKGIQGMQIGRNGEGSVNANIGILSSCDLVQCTTSLLIREGGEGGGGGGEDRGSKGIIIINDNQ